MENNNFINMCLLTTFLLLILKLTGAITWSWFWVFFPLFAPLLIFALIFLSTISLIAFMALLAMIQN